jgi:uncharacterized membrane protein required for colicin V production
MLALLVLMAWIGARRGLVRMLAGLAAFALSFLLAFRLYGPLGSWLATVFPSLSLTESRVIAFLAVVLLVGFAIDLGARLLTGAIRNVPVVGGLDRLGGLLAGVALGLLGVWLLTTCLLLLPASVTPIAAGLRRSEAAHLVRSVSPQWNRGLRVHLERVGIVPMAKRNGMGLGETSAGYRRAMKPFFALDGPA